MSQQTKLVWREDEVPEELLPMLRTLEEEYSVSDLGRGLKLKFKRLKSKEPTSQVIRSRGEVTVGYTSLATAARGIGSALAGISGEEKTSFRTLGIMLDVSRGMAMKVDHLKMWFRRLALAGYNMVMLYTEDVYQLPGEPYFGRHRGAYSIEELRELDAYAGKLGIQLTGCIQTLGHLEQIIRWSGAYREVTDTQRVLLVDEPKTYELIEKMIAFWSEALGSRRIHIGMDETQDLGRGTFMNLHGYENPFEIINRHLTKVTGICAGHGLKPMMWSDMFFRFGNAKHEYYNWESPIPESVQKKIPRNLDLCYWDYYHTDEESYRQMIRRHRSIGYQPVMASGIWTWTKLWYDHVKTMETVKPCIAACRSEKVEELFFTMWGDDGAYCNYDSSLAGIVRCGDLAYGCDPEDEKPTEARFEVICMADYKAHVTGSQLSQPDGFNPALVIWDDPLLGIYYEECRKKFGDDFAVKTIDRCEELLCKLLPYQDDAAAGNFEHLTNILDLIGKKLEMRGTLIEAYAHDDRIGLRQVAVALIPALIAALEEFDASFRSQWLDCAKPFGLELIQLRNGGQIARLEETALRVREYLDDQIDRIDELENLPEDRIQTLPNRVNFVVKGSIN